MVAVIGSFLQVCSVHITSSGTALRLTYDLSSTWALLWHNIFVLHQPERRAVIPHMRRLYVVIFFLWCLPPCVWCHVAPRTDSVEWLHRVQRIVNRPYISHFCICTHNCLSICVEWSVQPASHSICLQTGFYIIVLGTQNPFCKRASCNILDENWMREVAVYVSGPPVYVLINSTSCRIVGFGARSSETGYVCVCVLASCLP